MPDSFKKKASLFGGCVIFTALIFGPSTGFCTPGKDSMPFAFNGGLKMFYDNRSYPQAIQTGDQIYIVWRAKDGMPHITVYDEDSGSFAEPVMVLTGLEDSIDKNKYRKDHHFAPIIWIDKDDYIHVMCGWHGYRPKRPPSGIHLVSENPGEIESWKPSAIPDKSMSYPQGHRIYDDQNLLYYRHDGHLGYWTYLITAEGGKNWVKPEAPVIDMNGEPQDGAHASHAGSYNTTRISKDGKTLHVAFIWKVEDAVLNTRYDAYLHDFTQRYNLYYARVDLPSGNIYNCHGKQLARPVTKRIADEECLVWDTEQRVAAVGPSIYLDEKGKPSFVAAVSLETPRQGRFYYLRHDGKDWKKTEIANAGHPFAASHLDKTSKGNLRAYLITGDGETHYPTEDESHMDLHGWGDRIEVWESIDGGSNWELKHDLTPEPGRRYNNVKFVATPEGAILKNKLVYYGWDAGNGKGTAYLWKGREQE